VTAPNLHNLTNTTFIVLDPYRIEHVISADGNRIESRHGYGIRAGESAK
jgi:hypothetical protein